MSTNKKQIKEGIFDAADRFVANFFNNLSKGAADTIIKKAEKAKLPPDAIAHMKKMEKDAIEFRKFMKDL
jgi:uncharacterized protein (DUF169 family)